jgi:hypothetical protein
MTHWNKERILLMRFSLKNLILKAITLIALTAWIFVAVTIDSYEDLTIPGLILILSPIWIMFFGEANHWFIRKG